VPKKILLVEDNEDIREMMLIILRNKGFEVIQAENGRVAAEVAKTVCPDIIVTNICMPELDGVGLIEYIRKQPEFDAVPIVVLSAVGSGDRSNAMRAGANESMPKPVEPDALIESINRLFK
jgi:DNA-binding response OmpR family regulator